MVSYNHIQKGNALRIAVGMIVLGLLLASSANAATLKVCPSGCAYSSIQKAINASSNGDTILVKSGTYFENVKVNKKLTIRGIGNPVVDAGGFGSAITLSANGITLEGFTATGSYYEQEAGFKVTSSNNTMRGNNASNNNYGISLVSSNNNTIRYNNASNNRYGIYMDSSSNNTIGDNIANSNNYATDSHGGQSGYGISLVSSSNNNTLSGNNASNNGGSGIELYSSSNNTMDDNNATSNNWNGINIYSSNNNTMGDNIASNNFIGIYLESSSDNTLRGNIMTGNQENFDLDGDTDSDFDNHIDTNNLVDGRPIYYIIKASDATYDSSSNVGTLYCISCVNVTIKNLNLKNNGIGIFFGNTTHSRIQNVNASNNGYGIVLSSSSKNTLSDNNANSNSWEGISVWYSSKNTLRGNNASNNVEGIFLLYSNKNTLRGNNASNNVEGIYLRHSSKNKIYNNIFNNTENVYFVEVDPNINNWNTTRQSVTNIIGGSFLGGNFWANPEGTGFSQTCKDVNGDGICDKSYTLDENNIDYLPLSMNFMNDKIPPKRISKLKNVSYASSYINWTWKDPKDIDFKKVMVFIDDKFKRNVSKGKRYYNATNFEPNTRHTISTWTVDMNGNINKTWTNRSAWTAN